MDRAGRDLHHALKTEKVAVGLGAGVEFVLVKLQWGRDDIGYSLHADPRQWSTAGVQTPDLLGYLGFEREERCGFINGECYARRVEEGFSPDEFGTAFAKCYHALQQAEGHLEACGYPFEQREGWGIFFHKQSGARMRPTISGDGHTGAQIERMKDAEDYAFLFVLSWMSGQNKGWTIHTRPKHPPLSTEVAGVFKFLGLNAFAECPHFDFDECYWHFIPYEERAGGDAFHDNNAGLAHGWFEAHGERFSSGVERLLAAHAAVEPFGMQLLPTIPAPPQQIRPISIPETIRISEGITIAKREPYPTPPSKPSFEYDVAISYASTERDSAEALATATRDAGFNVFYDGFYPEQLWGKDLAVFFDDIYRKKARYAVILVSAEYAKRRWTLLELRSALARALEERGREYILPVKVDDTDLPGLPPTLGNMSLSQRDIEQIAETLIEKLRS